jgi:hypothetical protein
MQHYVIKFVSDRQHVGGFLQVLWFPPKSFLPVETEITVTKVFITANMKNSKSHCKQEVDVR